MAKLNLQWLMRPSLIGVAFEDSEACPGNACIEPTVPVDPAVVRVVRQLIVH